MSRDVLTVGSTMRIPLLYRVKYSQWVERFINYLEEQTDGEAMINSIKNGDQPLPRVTQVSISGTSSTEQPPLKDKSMWSDQEKKNQKIDRLARSLMIQGLPNDIYSLIDSNKTAKDLWDALARHMLGSEYGEQDRKATVLYEYETFKANEEELLLDTYIRYLQYATMMRQNKNLMDINIDALYNILKQNQGDFNDDMRLKKKNVVVTFNPLALITEKTKVSKSKEKVIVSSNSEESDTDDFSELKKITALLAKAFNRRKFYSKPTNNNLRTSSTSQSVNKKQEFVKSDNKKVEKKDDEKKRYMSKVKCYNCKKEGHFAKDCKKEKVKDYNYYKTKMLLAKKDSDEQVLLAEDQALMESNKASSSFDDDKISEVSYYLSESESESEYETSEYYDNTTTYGLFVNHNDDQEIFHECENFLENHIESQIDNNESVVDHNDSKGNDKLIRKFNKKIVKCQKRIKKANQQSKDYENQNKDLQDKHDVLKDQLQVKHVVINTHVECQEKYAKLEAERYEYMIRYSAYFDNDKQHRKQIADQEVLNDKMSVQLVESDKHVRDLKNTVLEKDFKISELKECVRNKDLEIEKCLERLNVCENKLHKMGQTNQTVHMIIPSKDTLYNGRNEIGFENPRYFKKAKDLRLSLYDEKVIGLGYTPMFLTHSDEALEIEKFKRARENKIEFAYDYGNLNASYQTSSLNRYVPNMILKKIIIDLEDEVVNLLEKEKANLKTIESLKSKECDNVENPKVIAPRMFKLNQSHSVSPIPMPKMSCDSNNVESKLKRKRRKRKSSKQNDKQVKNDKKKGLSNTSNVDLSSVSLSKLNKNVKRYSRKDLLSCNNSHLRETSSASVCNDAMNVSCNSRMYDVFDDNNFFILDDESVRISPVNKMPFRKKPRDYMNVRSKSILNKSLPRTVHRWLPKLK
nr:hypothetical protein [Tanacetum cinerariifolium]